MKNGWLDATLCNPKKQFHNLFVVIPAIATTHFPSEFATQGNFCLFFSRSLVSTHYHENKYLPFAAMEKSRKINSSDNIILCFGKRHFAGKDKWIHKMM